MKAVLKLASNKSKYKAAALSHILFDKNTAQSTDCESWASCEGPWYFPVPMMIPIDTVKAALKINKSLTWDNENSKLNGITVQTKVDPSDFPLVWGNDEGAIEITDLDLAQLKAIGAACAVKDIRYYLNGVCFDLSEGTIVATDGHRMHIAEHVFDRHEVKEGDGGQRIIPSVPFELAVSQKANRIVLTENRAILFHATGKITCKLLEGKFPDYKRVLPVADAANRLEGVDGQLAVLDAADAILKGAKWQNIQFCLNTGELAVYQNGSVAYSAPFFKPTQRDIYAGYMVKYLADVLKNTNEAVFYIASETNGALIECDKFKAVVMPCRI